jgi:hypothetical protein
MQIIAGIFGEKFADRGGFGTIFQCEWNSVGSALGSAFDCWSCGAEVIVAPSRRGLKSISDALAAPGPLRKLSSPLREGD